MRPISLLAVLTPIAMLGCSGGPAPLGGTSTGHLTTGRAFVSGSAAGTSGGASGGSAAGSGTTSTTSSGSTTSTGSTSTGSTTSSGASTGAEPACGSLSSRPLTDCPSGTEEVLGQVKSFCPGSTLGSLQITALGQPGVVASLVPCTGDNFFYFCLDGGSVSPEVNAGGNFLQMLFPVVSPPKSGTYIDGVEVVCAQVGQGLSASIPDYDPTKADLLITIDSSGDSTDPCANLAGWTFALESDGGVDAGTAYVNGPSFDPTATATDANGTVLYYDLDPGLQRVGIVGTNLGLLDAGVSCPYNGVQLYSTSIADVPLQGSLITFVPYAIP